MNFMREESILNKIKEKRKVQTSRDKMGGSGKQKPLKKSVIKSKAIRNY